MLLKGEIQFAARSAGRSLRQWNETEIIDPTLRSKCYDFSII